MAKAMKTIRESLNYQPQHAEYFAANQALFNRVVAFYFEVIQAHEGVLRPHQQRGPHGPGKAHPCDGEEPFSHSAAHGDRRGHPGDVPSCCHQRRLGSARSFSSSLKKWRTRKEKAQSQTRPERAEEEAVQRAPARPPPCMEQVGSLVRREVERAHRLIHPAQSLDRHLLELGQGPHVGRASARWVEVGSPALVRRGSSGGCTPPLKRRSRVRPKSTEQVTTNAETRICAVDLNLNEHLAVCTVQTVEGTILATRFIGGGRAIAGFRKQQLGRIARNRSRLASLRRANRTMPTSGARSDTQMSRSRIW